MTKKEAKEQKLVVSAAMSILGRMTSDKKKKSSAANGRLGGYHKNFPKKGDN
jgi:hypothetical protein